jgi:hypothetical protein
LAPSLLAGVACTAYDGPTNHEGWLRRRLDRRALLTWFPSRKATGSSVVITDELAVSAPAETWVEHVRAHTQPTAVRWLRGTRQEHEELLRADGTGGHRDPQKPTTVMSAHRRTRAPDGDHPSRTEVRRSPCGRPLCLARTLWRRSDVRSYHSAGFIGQPMFSVASLTTPWRMSIALRGLHCHQRGADDKAHHMSQPMASTGPG